MTGEAARRAAVGVRAKAIELAAELMQQDVGTLTVSDGR
jgi:hypothetical protein